MFHRSGTHSKFEITAPPNDLANKLKLQHPPPALLLTASRQDPTTSNQKPPVQRNKSHPLIDSEDRFSASVEVNGSSDKRNNVKKKNVFSFLKKKGKDEPDTVPPQRAMSRTPEGFGRKYISFDNPGSVPPIRRPHSSASDRHNNVHHRSMREKKYYAQSEDEDVDESRTGYPRYKPARVAPPIPIQTPNLQNGGYDSLEKYRSLKLSQSDDGSLVSSSGHSASLSSTADSSTVVPGLIGIKNHGNTCFMNSIVQCLSNSEPLLRYFMTGTYTKDLGSRIKKRRKSHPSVPTEQLAAPETILQPASDGAVTECVGLLIKCLWNGQYEGKISLFVRDVIGLWGQQYRGAQQHDAQEFLLWLLDRLHEDLNQATGEQRITKSPGRKSNEEEELAAETLSDHLQRHDSVIYNLFSAQYHSSLRCPNCHHLSNTFDPYLCISLSVPRRGSRPIYITMARRHQNSTRLMVFGMSLKVSATVRDIQRQLSVEARTLPHYLVISDMKQDGFYRFFRPNDPISAIGEYSLLYAYEVTPYRGEFTPSLPHPPPIVGGGGETIFVILQCRVGQGEYSKRFGSPMCLRVWRDMTYSQLQSVVFKNMRHYLHEGVNPEVVCRDYIFFKCLVLDGLQGQEYLDPYCPSPFMCPSVEKALSVSKLWGYEPHIKVIAEWEQWVKDTVCIDLPETPEDPIHPSVQVVREHYSSPLEASLNDCLDWHTKEEKLEEGETYQCHQCAQPQSGAVKRISFWTLPDILVIHLKRFEVDEYSQSKLNTFVRYPIRGLDMSPYLARPEQTRPSSAMGFRDHVLLATIPSTVKSSSIREKKKSSKGSLDKQGSSSTLPLKGVGFEDLRKTPKDQAHPKSKQKFVWKKSKKPKQSEDSLQNNTPPPKSGNLKDSNLYDLYAVCNHHGNMDSGHYISQCSNPVDGKWYTFDDHRVVPITGLQQVVTQHAYVLFYIRRGANHRQPLPAGSGKSEEHWVHKLLHQKMDISRIIPSLPDPTAAGKAQRQGSAQTLSTVSGISPDNMAIVSPPKMDVAPPHGYSHFSIPSPPSSYHTHQFSNGSSGGGPTSPHHSAVGYPQSLPSPSAQSTISCFSQPFTNRVGSYHGHAHQGFHPPQSKQHENNTRTATRL